MGHLIDLYRAKGKQAIKAAMRKECANTPRLSKVKVVMYNQVVFEYVEALVTDVYTSPVTKKKCIDTYLVRYDGTANPITIIEKHYDMNCLNA